MLTATTEITITVNGVHTCSIRNTPETGNYWILPTKLNPNDLIQAQFAIAETSSRMLAHKIAMDTPRVLNGNRKTKKV